MNRKIFHVYGTPTITIPQGYLAFFNDIWQEIISNNTYDPKLLQGTFPILMK